MNYIKVTTIPLVAVIGVYQSPNGLLCGALMQVVSLHSSNLTVKEKNVLSKKIICIIVHY